MSRQDVTSQWHESVRSSLAKGTKFLEAQALIKNGREIEGTDTVLITNFGRVVAAIIGETASKTPTHDSQFKQIKDVTTSWTSPRERERLLQQVAFSGTAFSIHDGTIRNIVPVADSFLDELLAEGDLKSMPGEGATSRRWR